MAAIIKRPVVYLSFSIQALDLVNKGLNFFRFSGVEKDHNILLEQFLLHINIGGFSDGSVNVEAVYLLDCSSIQKRESTSYGAHSLARSLTRGTVR